MADERLLLGEIVAAHGIKGLVKVRSYTEAPDDLVAYGPLHDEAGNIVELSLRGPAKSGLLAALPGINSRNDAERLKGTKLYVERRVLPALPAGGEEYYHADLIGLAVELPGGTGFGRVKAMHDFGAGDLLEIQPKGSNETIMVPFDRTAVPEVDLANGRVVIADPAEHDDGNDGGEGDE
ncbi:MAG: ribosome maturation factor RimM [Alphaproteobacteria bacterium]